MKNVLNLGPGIRHGVDYMQIILFEDLLLECYSEERKT